MNINRYFSFFIGIVFTIESIGQTVAVQEKERYWTIGPILYSGSGGTYEPDFLPGLMLKRKLNTFTLRTSYEHHTYIDKKDEITCCDVITSEGYGKNHQLKLGVEKGVVLRQYFRPYLASEITAMSSYFDQTREGGIFFTRTRQKIYSKGFGFFQSAGLEILINKKVSFAMESGVSFMQTKSDVRIEDLLRSSAVKTSSNKQNHTDFYFLSVCVLNIHF